MTEACPRCGMPRTLEICPGCLLDGGGGPRVVGPVELQEKIGRGGMGAVYRAKHLRLGRTVAVKLLPDELAKQSEFQQRFEREARALAMLNHPNIISVHDFGQSDGESFIVMEFVEGGSLASRMPVPPREAMDIAVQLCDALDYAHQRGIVHRDIKPENVLVDAGGRVKVTDFGIARLVGTDQRGWTVTTPEVAIGTPAYMAPEAMEGAAPNPQMDIYSAGVLLYQMITGKIPRGDFERLPGVLDRIVRRALSPDPAKRYASIGEMRRDLAYAKALPLADDLEPHEKQWLSAVALMQAISTAVALWAFLESITPKVRDAGEMRPLVTIGERVLENGKIYSRARFEMWWTIVALATFALAITAYGFLRHHWKLAGLERPQPDRAVPSSKWVLISGILVCALYVVRLLLERVGQEWIVEYTPVIAGPLLTLVLYFLWISILNAWRISRPLRREPMIWLGFGLSLIPPVHNLILILRSNWIT